MQVQISNIDKTIKNRISKFATPTLIKKYNSGALETIEEVISAQYYLDRRNVSDQIDRAAEREFYGAMLNPVDQEQVQEQPIDDQQTTETIDSLPFTNKEYLLLTVVKSDSGLGSVSKLVQHFEKTQNWTIRTTKAVVGSLRKKDILDYIADELPIVWSTLGQSIISGETAIEQKVGYKKTIMSKKRLTIQVGTKHYEKSDYVRRLLRENKHITTKEINEQLLELGFNKIYHSELMRCKSQLGMI